MKKEPLVKEVTPVSGVIYRGTTNCGPGFVMDVTYKLEDGSTHPGHVSARRKKDVQGQLERDQAAAKAGAMRAMINEEGKFWGVSQSYRIGPGSGGLVHNPKGIDTPVVA